MTELPYCIVETVPCLSHQKSNYSVQTKQQTAFALRSTNISQPFELMSLISEIGAYKHL
jgi:hypothetical protein